MRVPSRLILLYSAPSLVSAALHSLPEDRYAFPKYHVSFLNGLPLLNDTAQKWMRDGLRGGELEFLDQPWSDSDWEPSRQIKEIGSGHDDQQTVLSSYASPSYKLELMKMGPTNAYLCLIPPPPEHQVPSPPEEATEQTALHSWSLLQPLSGSCIYHRQGWFTYAYCHNSHVRQFREAARSHPHAAGGYQIEEDAEWEAYDLGRAPKVPDDVANGDLAVAEHEQAALAVNVELARGTGSRYLVQRWGDGTVCDKTGRRREIEVQFHCSMTVADSILFVKETKTCSYVLVINTPRLCNEPGFRSRIDQREETPIRCRHIVDADGFATIDKSLPEADMPIHLAQHQKPRPPLDAPTPPAAAAPVPDASTEADAAAATLATAVQRALERMLSKAGLSNTDVPGTVVVEDAGDGEMIIEFISEIDLEDEVALELDIEYDGATDANGAPAAAPDSARLSDALRALGLNVQGEARHRKGKGTVEEGQERKKTDAGKKNQKSEPRLAWPGEGARIEL